MVEIEGKRGRQVPLLLMPDIKKAMEILVKKRQSQHQSKQQVFLYPPVCLCPATLWINWCLKDWCTDLLPLYEN